MEEMGWVQGGEVVQVMRRILKAVAEPVKVTEDRRGFFLWSGSRWATRRQLRSKHTVAFVL